MNLRALSKRLSRIEAQLPSGSGGRVLMIRGGMAGLRAALLEIEGQRQPIAVEARGQKGGMQALLALTLREEARLAELAQATLPAPRGGAPIETVPSEEAEPCLQKA